jgi:hypothetical protein
VHLVVQGGLVGQLGSQLAEGLQLRQQLNAFFQLDLELRDKFWLSHVK